METINVLVVEPDPIRLEEISASLTREADFEVSGAGGDLIEALKACSSPSSAPDVLVINIDHQPTKRMKSWALLRTLLPDARVVALTKGEEDSVLEAALAAGFSALHPLDVEPNVLCRAARNAAKGGLDYAPFIVERIKKLLMMDAGEMVICLGGLLVDLEKQEVARWGRIIQLAPLEFKVIAYLARRRPEPVSSTELLENIWRTSPDMGGTVDQVKSCIKRLRQKIEPNPRHPRYIHSVRDRGYVLSDPMENTSHK
jgi:DNA-binding response OmpR family regulator